MVVVGEGQETLHLLRLDFLVLRRRGTSGLADLAAAGDRLEQVELLHAARGDHVLHHLVLDRQAVASQPGT